MKRTALFRKIISVVLATVIVFSVSVREVHYLFSHHQAHEHCENHWHSDTSHGNCEMCKFDVSLFTAHISRPQIGEPFFFRNSFHSYYHSVILHTEVFSNALRGPPSLA